MAIRVHERIQVDDADVGRVGRSDLALDVIPPVDPGRVEPRPSQVDLQRPPELAVEAGEEHDVRAAGTQHVGRVGEVRPEQVRPGGRVVQHDVPVHAPVVGLLRTEQHHDVGVPPGDELRPLVAPGGRTDGRRPEPLPSEEVLALLGREAAARHGALKNWYRSAPRWQGPGQGCWPASRRQERRAVEGRALSAGATSSARFGRAPRSRRPAARRRCSIAAPPATPRTATGAAMRTPSAATSRAGSDVPRGSTTRSRRRR